MCDLFHSALSSFDVQQWAYNRRKSRDGGVHRILVIPQIDILRGARR